MIFRTMTLWCGLGALALAACDDGGDPPADGPTDGRVGPDGAQTPDAAPDPDDGVPRDAAPRSPDAAPDPPDDCAIEATLARNGCATGGCHAPPIRASLDLVADNLGPRLVNAAAHTPGCEGRLLIDPVTVNRSLLLQAIGAEDPPSGAADTCQVVMPPGGTVSAADQACIRRWVESVVAEHGGPMPDPFEPPTIAAALRKVKTLLNGGAPTAEEVARVTAEPGALRDLVDEWAQGPAFERKLADFLLVALQQRLQTLNEDQFDRFRQHRDYRLRLQRVMEESFVRTALDVVQRGAPFSEVLTTRRWMVTTANLVLLRYVDQTVAEREQVHQLHRNPDDAPANLGGQVRQRSWPVPALEVAQCEVPQMAMLSVLFGFVDQRRYCRPRPESNLRFPEAALTEADFNDWRVVELAQPSQAPEGAPLIPFYDLPALRNAEQVVSRIPRQGFFTTSVFLANWATNTDNQFRVTTNQALLGALHVGFASSEPTEPLRDDGLDDEHSEPGSACYGCHRQLDPMRLYFARSYNVSYQRARSAEDGADLLFRPAPPASFAFRGVQVDEGGLNRFANTLADHPRFPVGWAQKLCLWANSARCDESDPHFVAAVDRFRDGLDLRELLVDLLSSPLVTGLEQTAAWGADGPPLSITRRAHLCALLDERTGRAGLCELFRVRQVIGLIPQDDFARGAVDPTQPARPSAFHFAAAEAVCEAVARFVVGPPDTAFSPQDPEGSLDAMVAQLMALPAGHARHDTARAALGQHFADARDQGLSQRDALRSAFVLGCLSPDVMGVGL